MKLDSERERLVKAANFVVECGESGASPDAINSGVSVLLAAFIKYQVLKDIHQGESNTQPADGDTKEER